MSNVIASLAAAIETFRPELEMLYSNQARRIAANILKDFGPTLSGIYNSNAILTYRAWVKPIISADSDRITRNYFVDEAKLIKFSSEKAAECIDLWAEKISSKLGDIEDADIKKLNGYVYSIAGKRQGKSVFIEQQLIVKSSSKGTIFNQFPARIYVDGKFTSEKKYHAMFN